MKRREEGSAIILSILILMSLTSLGLGLMLVSATERDIAVNDRTSRTAYLLAQSGLQWGEELLRTNYSIDEDLTSDLTGFDVADGTKNEIPATWPDDSRGTAFKGAVLTDNGAQDFYDIAMNDASGDVTGFIRLFVRNNADDPSGTPTIDSDDVVVLIAVGRVTDGNGQEIARRTLAERLKIVNPKKKTIAGPGADPHMTRTAYR